MSLSRIIRKSWEFRSCQKKLVIVMRVTKAYSFQEEIQALGARLREPTCHGRREIEPLR